MNKRKLIAWPVILISLALFVMEPSVLLVVFVFGVMLLLEHKIPRFNIAKNRKIIVFAVILLFSLLFEFSATLDPYEINEFGVATRFAEDGLTNMAYGMLFWIPFSLVWTWMLFHYSYSTTRVFLVGGIYGAFVEQNFLTIQMVLSGDFVVLLAAPFIGILYGAAITSPYILIKHMLPQNLSTKFRRNILPIIILYPASAAAFIIFYGINSLMNVQ